MPSPTPVVYAFYGQDQPTLKERLDDLVGKSTDPASADLNISKLDGRSVTSGEIENAARSLPFLADTRVVIVENLTDSASGRAVIDTLSDLVPTLPDSTRLIFIETNAASEDAESGGSKRQPGVAGFGPRASGRSQALKKLVNVIEADPRGTVINCEPPQDIARWLQDRAKRHNATLEGGGAKALAERIGGDLVLADSELAKLATYAGKRAINVEDVKTLTPASAEANVFQMVDALGQRRGQAALSALRALLDSGDEPLRIFGMIARQIRLLIQMREQLDAGASVNAAAQAMNQRDFVAKKLAEQARQYKMETLERILSLLLEMDIDIKTGQIDGELALEELVVRLAGKG